LVEERGHVGLSAITQSRCLLTTRTSPGFRGPRPPRSAIIGRNNRAGTDTKGRTMNVRWRGVFPAATTQFSDDGALNLRATVKHLGAMIDAGVHGMIMLGTVGENCSLEYREKLDVLRAAVDGIAGRVPVLTGVAECTTALACRFAADAQKLG